MALIIRTSIQPRFADFDSFGHANNIAQQSYFDVGKAELFQELWRLTGALKRIPAMIVSVQNDFFAQIRMEDSVEVVTRIDSIGEKSLTIVQSIMCGDRECSRSRTVMVCYDSETQQSVPVPDEWREYV